MREYDDISNIPTQQSVEYVLSQRHVTAFIPSDKAFEQYDRNQVNSIKDSNVELQKVRLRLRNSTQHSDVHRPSWCSCTQVVESHVINGQVLHSNLLVEMANSSETVDAMQGVVVPKFFSRNCKCA